MGEEHGIQHKTGDGDHGKRLFDQTDVVSPKDVKLPFDIRKLVTPRWMMARVVLHGYPQDWLSWTARFQHGHDIMTGRHGRTSQDAGHRGMIRKLVWAHATTKKIPIQSTCEPGFADVLFAPSAISRCEGGSITL